MPLSCKAASLHKRDGRELINMSDNRLWYDVKICGSLFLHLEDNMLVRLDSDAWQGDLSKPVFIDRNGITFELVLDYLSH